MFEQWKFISEFEREGKPGVLWRWVRHLDSGSVQHSGQRFRTLWDCIKDATRAGYDDELLGPVVRESAHTMVSRPPVIGAVGLL